MFALPIGEKSVMSDQPDNGIGEVLSELMASLRRRAELQEAHRAECSIRPCERCEIWLCGWRDDRDHRCNAETGSPIDDRLGHERPPLCDMHAKLWDRKGAIEAACATIPPSIRSVATLAFSSPSIQSTSGRRALRAFGGISPPSS